ncbi:MAG: UDP-N-acetylmuramoyl-L-alanyl-D-glutamate--2,6-diaminopimelate ligase [Flavobacteriales bacterium]|nr:UDP-N-acetylmuramoyl-L-alanyl-D-glutamate--2,6-diaminopimelate ligase [Flavobacteriales bacterium]
MKLLKDILYKAGIEEMVGNTNIAITEIHFDSRKVTKDSAFVAVSGTQVDGHDFIQTAIDSGANMIVCERLPESRKERVTYVVVKDSSYALGIMASAYYDHPSERMKLVAVTGTNGKTSVVTMLYRLVKGLGYKAGLLSTVDVRIDTEVLEATHTTPDALAINKTMALMVEKGVKYCFMEASSHAIHQNRMAGLQVDVAVFTNITHEHLDYHGEFNEYIKAKKKLFDDLNPKARALVNRDDKHGETMVMNTRAKVYRFGLKGEADYKVRVLENTFGGLVLKMNEHELYTKLIGQFNAYNLATVFGVSDLLGIDQLNALTTLSTLNTAPGRFQYVRNAEGVTGIVDYAHTPDALKNVLETIAQIRGGNETVITVVGAGGDRDKSKRPEMARIAAHFSDRVILTSDNPRTENPETIIEEMKAGLDPIAIKKTLSIASRREAIRTACSLAQAGDIILVAGKGHEKYQEINGVKHPFDDLEILNETLKPQV